MTFIKKLLINNLPIPNIRFFILLVASVLLLASSMPAFAEPLDNWHERVHVPDFGLMGISGIAYGNNSLVAVGSEGIIFSSTDGINWSVRSSGTYDLRRVIFGNGKFVAVGGTILTSTDGITWTSNTPAITGNLSDVTYGNGTFVAFGYNTILTSTDGITWTSNTSAITGNARDITYGNGTFVVVGEAGILTSTDGGTTWIKRSSDMPYEVTFGNGTFVAFGYGTILTSTDGVSWVSRPSVSNYSIFDLTYGNGTFVAVGDYGTILTSTDGATWTDKTFNGNPDGYYSLNCITYGNNTFVAMGNDYKSITSTDGGSNWTIGSKVISYLLGVTYGNDTFVAVGYGGAILTSTDGTTWTSRYSGTSEDLHGITFGNGTFLAVGGSGTSLTSTNGVTWIVSSSGTNNTLEDVAFGNGTFVAVEGTGTIFTSTDGATWTSQSFNDLAQYIRFNCVTYGNNKFVVAGSKAILTSTDGVDWASSLLSSDMQYTDFDSVTYGNGTFVAVADFESIYTSPDGFTWTERYYSSDSILYGITFGNGTFAAVGYPIYSGYNTLLTSEDDGATWDVRYPSIQPEDITYGNGTFVAVGGGIIQSDPLTLIDITPPAFATDYPKAGTVSSSSIEIKVKADENGYAYFVCLPSGAAVPTPAQVKAGHDAAGISVNSNLKGNIALAANLENSFSVTGLAGNTDYDIYVIAEDGVPNLQAGPAKLMVKTMMTDNQAVSLDKAALEIIYVQGDSNSSVTQNVTLPINGDNGTTITWSSDNLAISNTGVVTRPSYNQGDALVTLTAAISKNTYSETKQFFLIVKSIDNPDLIGDINGDSKVDIADLGILAQNYGLAINDLSYDFVPDGIIDIYDLVRLSKALQQ